MAINNASNLLCTLLGRPTEEFKQLCYHIALLALNIFIHSSYWSKYWFTYLNKILKSL